MPDETTPVPAPLPEVVTLPPGTVSNGYLDFTAAKRDGTTQLVRIFATPLSEIPKYAELLPSPSLMIEFSTKQPAGWSDTLTEDAFFEIDGIARELSDPRMARWLQRQMTVAKRAEVQIPAGLVSMISLAKLGSS